MPSKLADLLPAHLVDEWAGDLQKVAKQIQQNLIDHQEKETPLTEETKLFLQEFTKMGGALPVTKPEKARQETQRRKEVRDKILEQLEAPGRMRVSRIKKRK